MEILPLTRKETKPTADLVSELAISPVTPKPELHVANTILCSGLEILRGLTDATTEP